MINQIVESPIWQPFTQMQTAPLPLLVKRGNRAWLELADGRKILDCISSWWVTLHGHANPIIAEAIYQQAQVLEQVIFSGFSHEPAETLARRVLSHLPPELTRVFFSDDGSTSVEVALKMAFQYWLNRDIKNKSKFISFESGYHGDTVGAMSLGQGSGFWNTFSPLLIQMDLVPFPATWQTDLDVEKKEIASLTKIENLLDHSKLEYAGIIIEPLIQGAGGMRMCRPEFLKALEHLCRKHQVLLIYDEVMTGFGRTGDWFASIKSDTAPDIICLSKGLSGGFLPIALTVATEEIYQAFLGEELRKAFFHSHSFTANPLACAAANASLTLLEENPNVFRDMESIHQGLLEKWLKPYPYFKNIRTCGTIMAAEIEVDGPSDYFSSIGPKLRQGFIERGFLIRPLGNTIYLMPPYCITLEELELAYEAIHQVVENFSNKAIRMKSSVHA